MDTQQQDKVYIALRGMAGEDRRVKIDTLEVVRVSTMLDGWGGYGHRTRTGDEVGFYAECLYDRDKNLAMSEIVHWHGPISVGSLIDPSHQLALFNKVEEIGLPKVNEYYLNDKYGDDIPF